MTAPSYSLEQQIHSISLLSNGAFGVTSYNSIADLQQYVATLIANSLSNSTIQGLIGSDWQVVWGPVIWSHSPNSMPAIADNTMVLLYSPSQNQFVVAIAGTNIDSMYGWLTEDFQVSTTVTWQSVVGSDVSIPSNYAKAAIAQGTSAGLSALLGMVDGSSQSMLAALTSFLSGGTVSPGANIAVAGHSLGGALAPVLALYIQNLQSWNASGTVTMIGAWPTAGPTPGESNFAGYYAWVVAQPPGSGQAGLAYTSKYNSLDVVPHAWQSSCLAMIPTIYEPSIQPPAGATPTETIVGSLGVGGMLNALNSKNLLGIPEDTYTQVAPWTELTGTFDTTTDNAVTTKLKQIGWVLPSQLQPYSQYFTNFVRFLAQLAFQHTTAYTGSAASQSSLLDILQFSIAYQSLKSATNVSHETEAQLHRAALRRAVGVDIFGLDTEGMAIAASRDDRPKGKG